MFGIFGKKKKTEFRDALMASLPDSASLAPEIWKLIDWLESQNQTYRYRNSSTLFLPTVPVDGIDHLWSNIVFQTVPDDLVRHWFGQEFLETQVIPFIRCGGDGSYLALWCVEGENDRYVFLGSEGEAFVFANNALDFIILITMGYGGMEGRDVIEQTPQQVWQEYRDDPWPSSDNVRAWVIATFDVDYPETAAELVPKTAVEDPFEKFVQENIGY